jgi:uncharacterized membrane protein HdeD (DUF308 family)
MSVTSTPIPVIVRKSLGWSIALSILMILAGILAIVIPPAAGIAITVLFGWLLIFSGIAHWVFGWQTRSTGGLIFELLLGIVYVAAGGYLLWNPITGMVTLTLALAIYLFAESILEFILAVRLRPMPGSGWLFVDSIITLVLAIIIYRTWPANAGWVLGIIVGFSMLFSGFSRLMLSLAARRLVSDIA